MKRFSIIIIAYNLQEVLERAIESVINQNFINYELIIVDDNSNDNTRKIINEYKEKYNFISVFNEHNRGPGGARNAGFEQATGEYILYLDGDDTFYNNYVLSKINRLIADDTPDILYLGYQEIGGFNKLYIQTKENSTKEALLTCCLSFHTWSKCYRRDFLKQNNIAFVENMYYEDMIYVIKCTILSEKYKYGSFPIINYYRDRKGSIMHMASIEKCSDMYRYLAILMDLYEQTPDMYKKYLLSFIINETNNLPDKIKLIVKAIDEGTDVPLLSKRNYKLVDNL